jgi:hypothetical protein
MKIKGTLLSLSAMAIATIGTAQKAEIDDMYFTAKDRAMLVASQPVTKYVSPKESLESITPINPTDSYSARNVNPEYLSQSKMNSTGSSSNAPYFIPNYTPTGINQSIYNNPSLWNNYATAWNNPYFGMMPGFGSPFGSFYPYGSFYRSYYDPFCYSGFNNFYQPGWSSFWSIGWGSGWNTWGSPSWAWGGSPFWNNYYYNNWLGWNSWNNFGYGYYPGTVVIINNGSDYNGRKAVYGKRESRSSDVNNYNYVNTSNRSGNPGVVDSNGKTRGSSGRTSGSESTGYYQKGWRTNPNTNPSVNNSGNSWSGSRSSHSNWSNGSNSRGSDSFFQNNSRSSGGLGNNSSFSGGGSSRSSGGGISSGGSSSGSKRGRD